MKVVLVFILKASHLPLLFGTFRYHQSTMLNGTLIQRKETDDGNFCGKMKRSSY